MALARIHCYIQSVRQTGMLYTNIYITLEVMSATTPITFKLVPNLNQAYILF